MWCEPRPGNGGRIIPGEIINGSIPVITQGIGRFAARLQMRVYGIEPRPRGIPPGKKAVIVNIAAHLCHCAFGSNHSSNLLQREGDPELLQERAFCPLLLLNEDLELKPQGAAERSWDTWCERESVHISRTSIEVSGVESVIDIELRRDERSGVWEAVSGHPP